MNCCYDCTFQGVRKNRTENAIIIVSKNKISKNIRIFLNKFSGYVCALCGFICLKVINFFIISWLSTWKNLKDKAELQFFFIVSMLGWNLYFMIALISGSPILWLTGSVSLYWRIPSVVMILEKNSF